MNDAEFFSEMVERHTAKDGDKAVTSSGKPKDKRGLNPMLAYIAPMGAQAFDAYSTREAMKSGGREGNPAMSGLAGNPAALYGVKVGSALLIGIAADKLAKSGHRNLGKGLSMLSIGVPLGAGINNMSKAGK